MLKVLVISGTPGTGKSTLAKGLAKKLNFQRLDLSKYYREISSGYQQEKQCYDIDLKKFEKLVREKKKELRKNHKKGLIIDSHIAHLLPRRLVNLCIVLACPDLKLLERRLKKRGYPPKKIQENLQAEIFQVCLEEAKEKKHKIILFEITEYKKDKKKFI